MRKFLYIFWFLLFCACNYSVNNNRPNNIPANSIWKGGSDGGCWIAIKKINDKLLEGKIFYENGELWKEGKFIKDGECNIDQSEILDIITGFDGQSLLTKHNCKFTLK